MIQQIMQFDSAEIAYLERSYRGMQILSYQKAYGFQYKFCRFFRLTYLEGNGWMLLFNSTLFICAENKFPTAELQDFIRMHMPFRIECDACLVSDLSQLSMYQAMPRTTFALTPSAPSTQFEVSDVNMHPKLDDVYDILQEGFPNLMEYDLWLTDASHRERHQISRFFTYKNISTLSWMYDWKDSVLVGQVATRTAYRGQGFARDFLCWTASELFRAGKQAVLYALDIRVSFYQEIGFPEIATELILERQDVVKDQPEKGAL